MGRRKTDSIVSSYLENVSGTVLEQYPKAIKTLIHGYSGIYALYKGERLYYIGLAGNLRIRLSTHLKDRHARKWDRFSVYLTTMADHVKPLESLILWVAMPPGNPVRGKLPRAANMTARTARLIREENADALTRLMGGKFARQRRKTKTQNQRGSLPLAGRVERRIALRADYKGKTYRATLRKDGQIGYAGRLYKSPFAATRAVPRRPGNGWHFWHYQKGRGNWVRLGEIRR